MDVVGKTGKPLLVYNMLNFSLLEGIFSYALHFVCTNSFLYFLIVNLNY